jgi:lysophospholipase L1-like esterase
LGTGTPYLFFAFGANDMTAEGTTLRVPVAESVANFRMLLEKARQRYPLLVMGPLPVGDPAQDTRIQDLCHHYAQAAAALAIPYLPLATHLIDNTTWQREVAANDGSHPGAAGYDLLAQHVLAWSAWWFQ